MGTVQVAGGSSTFGGLTYADSLLQITGGTATITGYGFNRLDLAGGTLDLSLAPGQFDGPSTWSSGAKTGFGAAVFSDLSITGTSGNLHQLNGYFANRGVTTWAGNNSIGINEGTIENNAATFIADAPSGNTLDCFGTGVSGGTFIVFGDSTFSKTGTGTARFRTSTSGVTFFNYGTVDVQAGTLSLESGVYQLDGTQLTGGTWLVHDGATLAFTSGSNIATNLANVTLDGPTSTFAKINTLVDNQGQFSVLNGRTFTAVGTFSNFGALTINGGSTFTAPSLTQLPGNTLTAGTWYIGLNSTLSVTSGANITRNDANVTLDGAGSTFSQINTLQDNRGSFTISNGRNFGPRSRSATRAR